MPSQIGPDPRPDAAWSGWIEKMSQGDEASLVALYGAALSRIYGLALRITRNAAMAEEVVEEVFYQAWRTAATFDGQRSRPLVWLLVICRSLALKKIRTIDRSVTYDDDESLHDQACDESTDPQSLLLATEQHTALHRALLGLSEQERDLVRLAFFQDLSYAEIARSKAMPLGTVKTNMRRALHTLRRRLGGPGKGD